MQPGVEKHGEQKVSLAVENGTLLGFGSALAKTDEVFNKNEHDSYRGRVLAVIRAGDAGEVHISASSDGYETAIQTIAIGG